MAWKRKYDFQSGTKISSSQVDEEFNQLISAVNENDAGKVSKAGDTIVGNLTVAGTITEGTTLLSNKYKSKPTTVSGTVLYTGNSLVTSDITGLPNINTCENGWMLEWGNDTSTFYYAYTPVFKWQIPNSVTIVQCGHSDQIGGIPPVTDLPVKGISITDSGTTLSGITGNGSGAALTRFLKRIIAF